MDIKKVRFDVAERNEHSETTDYAGKNTNKTRKSKSYKPIRTPVVELTGYKTSEDDQISSYAEFGLQIGSRFIRSLGENMDGRFISHVGEHENAGFEKDPAKRGDIKLMKGGSQSSSDDSGIALNNLSNKDKSPGKRLIYSTQ